MMPAGQTYAWTFRLKVTKLIPDAEGRVESNPAACECQGYPDDTDRSYPRNLADQSMPPFGR
ncbi:hypothetical protein ACIA5D_28815 [Actinoplanes sp. NPDC051513]|uniref:hypothetical protein n=1 Tax=Actinoplanes sp. NPDC051513 TaxID=3363908 RepID=UPI00379545C6